MVGLTLGTGVGGVIAIDGRVHQGHDGTAGEIGHQTIDPDGPAVRLRQPRLSRGVRPGRSDRRRLRHGDRRGGRGGGPRRRPASPRRAGRRRALPRDRHRQHDHGRLARSGGHRRRHRRRGRPPARTDPRRAARSACGPPPSTSVEVVPAELGTWAGRDRGGGPRRRAGRACRPAARADAARRRAGPDDRRPLPAALPPDRAGPARTDRGDAAGRTRCPPTPSCAPSSGSAG